MGAERRHRRVPRTRIALGAARARAGRRRPDPSARAPRRALGVVLRARAREGVGPPRGRPVHVGNRGRELPPRRARSAPRPRAVDRLHRRPPARAPRHRCRADHRPGEALRRRGALVLRRRRARRSRGRRRGVAGDGGAHGRRRARSARPAPCTSTSRSASRWCPPVRRSSTRPVAPTVVRGRPGRPASAPRATGCSTRSPR